MNRLLSFITGAAPAIGVSYYVDNVKLVLTDEDVSNGIVRIRYAHFGSDYLTFREFHSMYSTKKKLTKHQIFEGKE